MTGLIENRPEDPGGYARHLPRRGVALRATEQPIDTSTAAGKVFLDRLGGFAEFESKVRCERQLEGIAAAEPRGVYKGRQAHIDQGKLGPAAIALWLGIGRASVYRVLGKMA
jgi:DNA invertase Pin-like site-specific DNA recombinase